MTNCYGLDFNRALDIDYVYFIDEWSFCEAIYFARTTYNVIFFIEVTKQQHNKQHNISYQFPL